MGKYIFTSDLHFTARPKDDYRWDIFPWLTRRIKAWNIDALFILGDLTDQKNHHPAELVDRLVREFEALSKLCKIKILKGNHDYEDPRIPFFRFLSQIPGVSFYCEPASFKLAGDRFLMLPHSRKEVKQVWRHFKFDEYDFVLTHITIVGSMASNGYEMEEGVDQRTFSRQRLGNAVAISGDIHVPQKASGLYYCGSPYPVRFGDIFKPRVLLWNGEKLKSVSRGTISKASITISSVDELVESGLTEGDQVKITFLLPRSQFADWEQHRADLRVTAERMGLEVHGIALRQSDAGRKTLKSRQTTKGTDTDVFRTFCKNQKLSPVLRKAGEKLI